MNIFVLDRNPVVAAQMQCDKHIVKMIVESGQMLSTAHRMLDAEVTRGPSKSGKTIQKKWVFRDEREDVLYKAVHMYHPCTTWTMQSVHTRFSTLGTDNRMDTLHAAGHTANN
jgi:hypothetical protein